MTLRPEATLADLPQASARRFGNKPAIITPERTLSFEELASEMSAVAAGLARLGIRPGDRVTLYGPNAWQWVVAYYAILHSGAIVVPINSLMSAAEVAFMAQDCRARAIVAAASHSARIDLGTEIDIITYGSGASGVTVESLAASKQNRSKPVRSKTDIASICYTSGTTGRPKGASLRHSSLIQNVASTSLMHGRSADDIIVTALPLPHVYGNVVMNSTILVGATLVLLPIFEPAKIVEAMERYRATMFEGVPTMYYYLLEEPTLRAANLQSLRLCTAGGQTMPPAAMEAVETAFGCPLIELWGMTELGGLGTTHPHLGPYRHGSIGTPLPFVEARIASIDDPTVSMPLGSPGELLIRGPIVMAGYWDNEAATAEVVTPDGWLRTGDIACQDEAGFISIVDRKKDMILTAGYNVYPAELERVIAELPAVAMTAVAGAPDDLKGEIAVAFVVPKAGSVISSEDVISHCRAHLAAYKVPRRVEIVSDLPKTSTGKIMRRALRASAPTIN